MVFCDTRAAVNHLTARFSNRSFSVVALSGELSQTERSHALQAMRDGRARVCVATDVAARGIDLPNLDLVIHADLPTNPETLLHRSGRTGRAGRKGVSALIVPQQRAQAHRTAAAECGAQGDMGKPALGRRRHPARRRAHPCRSRLQRAAEGRGTRLRRRASRQARRRTGGRRLRAAVPREPLGARGSVANVAPFTPSSDKFARRDEPPGRRDDFGDSVWFSLSVGRRQNAEPRWLIPMLCRTGGITKREIGSIKMQPEETFVQIAAAWADRFLAAIGPDRKLQNNIAVKRLDGTPDLSRAGYQAPRPEKKPHRGKRTFDQNAPRPKFETRVPGSDGQRPAAAFECKAVGQENRQAEIRKHRPRRSRRNRRNVRPNACRPKVRSGFGKTTCIKTGTYCRPASRPALMAAQLVAADVGRCSSAMRSAKDDRHALSSAILRIAAYQPA